MDEHQLKKPVRRLYVLAAICLVALSRALGQAVSLPEKHVIDRSSPPAASICQNTTAPSQLKGAFRQVCLRKSAGTPDLIPGNAIVIGFVGGFVKHDDAKHPEVQFAAYLRNRYPSGFHSEVFSNHEGPEALTWVLRLLDADGDGTLSTEEKEQAKIIIYGHSWGASQTVTLARELGRNGIPVLLTIQVDIIAKFRQKGSTIPPNVANAINFYQPRGLLHGRSEILAADPKRTRILGNLRMTYEDHPINCDNYRWFARVFNKPHHEIENDPRVWDQAALLVDSQLSSRSATTLASSPSKSQLSK